MLFTLMMAPKLPKTVWHSEAVRKLILQLPSDADLLQHENVGHLLTLP